MLLRGSSISERAARLLLAVVLAAAAPAGAGRALAAEAVKPKGEAVDGPTFIQLRPIILPIVEGNRVTRTAGLVLALELEKGKTALDFEPKRDKLRDAFITEIYTYIDQHSEATRVLDVSALKARLQQTSDRVLGQGFVHAVLVEQAFERPRAP